MHRTTHDHRPTLSIERALWAQGHRFVAGVDEAGRGAWAGPVVAAAVILPPSMDIPPPLLLEVRDSKQLSPAQREQLYEGILCDAMAVGVGSVPAIEIDRIGIVAATRQAMALALAQLRLWPDYLLIDYLQLPEAAVAQRSFPKADALSVSVAAASIVAKVRRDRLMVALDSDYPGYGFARHKGYGTNAHREALARLGPCPVHRRSFAPIRRAIEARPR